MGGISIVPIGDRLPKMETEAVLQMSERGMMLRSEKWSKTGSSDFKYQVANAFDGKLQERD